MINEKRIIENLETFSFPRLSGTDGERKAFKIAKEKISKLEVKPVIQDFTFSTYFGRAYPKIAFSLGFLLILIMFLNIESLVFFITTMIILLTFLFLFLIAKNPEKIKFGKKLNSQNIFVKLSSKSKDNETNDKNILFLCHLDSKGQRFSIRTRIRAIRLWVFSGLAISIVIILKNYIFIQFSLFFYIIGAIPLFLNLIATILIFLNTTNNISRGAIDNASGIAVVLELLTYYTNKDHNLNQYNLWFIFTGIEECGTMGIRHFYNNEIKSIDRTKARIFNFDAIGKNVYIFPNKWLVKNNSKLLNSFVKNRSKLNFKRNPKKIYFGTHTDGSFLAKKGFIGIGFGDMDSYEYMHSINDTIDKVNAALLARLCETITISLKDLGINSKAF